MYFFFQIVTSEEQHLNLYRNAVPFKVPLLVVGDKRDKRYQVPHVRTKVQYQVSGFYHKRKLREQQNENPKASENGKRYRVTLPLKDNGGTKHVIILQLLSNNNSIHDCEL